MRLLANKRAPRAGAERHGEILLDQVLPKLDKPWYRYDHLLRLNLLLIVPILYSYLNGFDGSMMNGLQSLPVWIEDFDHPSGSRLGTLTTMQTVGSVLALPIAPVLTDILGRRHPVVIGGIVCVLGGSIQGGAMNLGMFIAGRFFIGLGAGLINNACGPLVAELTYPSHRPFMTSLYSTTWYLGSIVAAWSTYGTFKIPNSWSWRIPSLLQLIPSVIQIATIYLVPESPRWLVKKGHVEKAKAILTKYHAGGEEGAAHVELEIAEIESAIEIERQSNGRSYLDFFSSKGNIWRFSIVCVLGLMYQWAGNGLVSSYLIIVLNGIGITNGETQNLINGGLQLFNYATAILGAVLVTRMGRRSLMLATTAGMFFAFLIWTVLTAVHTERDSTNSSVDIAIVVMIFIFYMFYNLGYNVVPLTYVLEILPFTLRAKGVTVFGTTATGAILFNGYANPIALEAIAWKYYIVWLVLLVVWFLVIFFVFPETSGRSLEEIAELFDGSSAMENVGRHLDKETAENITEHAETAAESKA